MVERTAALTVFSLLVMGIVRSSGRTLPARAPAEGPLPAAQGRVVVRYNTGGGRASKAARPQVVTLEKGESLQAGIARLQAHEDVLQVEPDYEVRLLATPNDEQFPQQWGPRVARAPAAWDTHTGSDAVTVCIIDTGVDYTHPEIAPNMHPARGYNALTGTNDPMDDHSHGTHVAGIIGAAGNNALGVAGVNWRTQILACKFMDSTGTGYMSGILDCLDFCVKNGAAVSSNSYILTGLDRTSSILRDAIAQAGAAGHLFIGAAGNSAANNDLDVNPGFPAAFALDNMLSVAALEASATGCDGAGVQLASYSNVGAATVHLAAPGSGILSTTLQNSYKLMSGTSMAAPFVAGAAALLASATGGKLPLALLRQALLESAQPLACLSGSSTTGGMLDIAAALQRALKLAAALPPPPLPPVPQSVPPPPPPSRDASSSKSPSSMQAGQREVMLPPSPSVSATPPRRTAASRSPPRAGKKRTGPPPTRKHPK